MQNKLFIIMATLCLVGCATTAPVISTVEQKVEVPVSVPCKVEIPAKPDYNFSKVTPDQDIYTKIQSLLADRKLSQGYEGELEIALISCTK